MGTIGSHEITVKKLTLTCNYRAMGTIGSDEWRAEIDRFWYIMFNTVQKVLKTLRVRSLSEVSPKSNFGTWIISSCELLPCKGVKFKCSYIYIYISEWGVSPNGIFYPCARWGWGWPDLGVLPPAPSRPMFGKSGPFWQSTLFSRLGTRKGISARHYREIARNYVARLFLKSANSKH